LLVTVITVLFPAVGRAELSEAEKSLQAKQRYEAGMVHFRLDEWEKAIAEFEAGFRLRPAPEFLYKIPPAYRPLHPPDKATAFHRKYLAMEPDAPNRPQVERRMAELNEELQRHPPPPEPQPPSTPPAPRQTTATQPTAPSTVTPQPATPANDTR